MAKIDFEQAIEKPLTDIPKLVIGIVFSIVPIIHWLAKGFRLECSGVGKTKPSKKMPEFKNWKYLLIKGLAADIILLIYTIPAILVFLIGIGSVMGTLTGEMLTASEVEDVSQLISETWYLALPTLTQLAPIMMLGFILLLIALYLSPIAVLNYLKNKKFSEAFSLSKITKKVLTMEYFVTWVVALVIRAILTIILLNIIPWFGIPIALFISGIIAYSLYGDVYRKVK